MVPDWQEALGEGEVAVAAVTGGLAEGFLRVVRSVGFIIREKSALPRGRAGGKESRKTGEKSQEEHWVGTL